jgi:hypothetical protein
MHPTKADLKSFVENQLSDEHARETITAHLKLCEFCREFCEDYRLLTDSLNSAASVELLPRALKLAERLHRQASTGRIISLVPLSTEVIPPPTLMAADSEPGFTPDVVCLATLYSEAPELILRLMRDRRQGSDYLQLIGSDAALVSNVLIEAPTRNRQFLTDQSGRVPLDAGALDDLQAEKWQIKMPEADFQLTPLVYDSERVEYASDVLLETDKNDQIKVTFAGKTEGKEITIQILKLNGSTDFKQVRVSLSQDNAGEVKTAAGDRRVTFAINDRTSTIGIRLFE